MAISSDKILKKNTHTHTFSYLCRYRGKNAIGKGDTYEWAGLIVFNVKKVGSHASKVMLV